LEVFFPDLGLLSLKNHPGEEGEGFQQGSLKFDCLRLGDEWQVTFKGVMDLKGAEKEVEIDFNFKAATPVVDFHNAMIVESTSKSIAKAKWSKAFFTKLEEAKKHHFEQGGRITGTIKIDGDIREVDFSSMRDHSWGIRKWGGWKRHVWVCGMMENNEAFNMSMVEYNFMGQLTAGFITEGKNIHYLREFHEINEFASDPLFPEKLDLKLKYSDGKEYHLICDRQAFVPYDMDGEYKINEGVSFGTVNGVPVKLVTEFGYNPDHYDI